MNSDETNPHTSLFSIQLALADRVAGDPDLQHLHHSIPRAMGFRIPHVAAMGVFLVFVGLATVLSRSRGAMATLVVSVILTVAGSIWQQERPIF